MISKSVSPRTEAASANAMKNSRFTTEQITFALRQAEAGLGGDETCRKLGISQATFFRWKAKYGELGTPEVRRLRQPEEENAKLKQLVADLSLDKKMLQDVLAKKPEPGAAQGDHGGPDGPLRRQCAAGLPGHRLPPLDSAIPRDPGCPGAPQDVSPGVSRLPGALRRSPAPQAAPPRGLGRSTSSGSTASMALSA